MGRRNRKKHLLKVFEEVEILDAGSEGKAVARVDNHVIFIPYVAPGDVVDIKIVKEHRRFLEGRAMRFHRYAPQRTDPVCSHFGTCGGCKWQHLSYTAQLQFKQKQVIDNLERIGKLKDFELLPILGSASQYWYRNKLEFTFSKYRWKTREEIEQKQCEEFAKKPSDDDGEKEQHPEHENALGFHIPGRFDKILDIDRCYLQGEPSNDIRTLIKSMANERNLSFYDVRKWEGFLRNLIIRTSTSGDVMVILVVREEKIPIIREMLNALMEAVPSITSAFYVINQKKNDALGDQTFIHHAGDPYIREIMPAYNTADPDLIFRIGPNSFFQTNSRQAPALYRTVADFADFSGDENVLDLYTGTGTIANYIARYVHQVKGIESVVPAIEDARINARENGITNASFTAEFAEKAPESLFLFEGHSPDVILTDPPRSGMHETVIERMIMAAPRRIVYVSCNPATQARDMDLMRSSYRLVRCQPVDMFPQTHHVENVALLEKRD